MNCDCPLRQAHEAYLLYQDQLSKNSVRATPGTPRQTTKNPPPNAPGQPAFDVVPVLVSHVQLDFASPDRSRFGLAVKDNLSKSRPRHAPRRGYGIPRRQSPPTISLRQKRGFPPVIGTSGFCRIQQCREAMGKAQFPDAAACVPVWTRERRHQMGRDVPCASKTSSQDRGSAKVRHSAPTIEGETCVP